jgi:hypothetical protein
MPIKMMNHAIKVKMFDANPDNEPTIYEHFATEDSVGLKYIFVSKLSLKMGQGFQECLFLSYGKLNDGVKSWLVQLLLPPF